VRSRYSIILCELNKIDLFIDVKHIRAYNNYRKYMFILISAITIKILSILYMNKSYNNCITNNGDNNNNNNNGYKTYLLNNYSIRH